MSGKGEKRKKSQKSPKNPKRRKVELEVDPPQTVNSSAVGGPWEDLPKELWEAIFDLLDTGHVRQRRKIQLLFVRLASKALNARCKEYVARLQPQKLMPGSFGLADVMASQGYLSCLKYVLDSGNTMTWQGLEGAIRKGPHLDVIKYAIEELKLPWTKSALEEIVKKDDAKLLRYAKNTRGAKFLDQFVCYLAAETGSLDCLKQLQKWRVVRNDAIIFAYAAGRGRLECVKFLHECGCEWGPYTCSEAATSGNLELLKYCHENGAEWNDAVVKNSAGQGHFDCLKYAIEFGAPFATKDLNHAMGHFECLKYLHELLGAWPDPLDWREALKRDQLECVTYAHEHGARWSHIITDLAAELGATKCLKYVREHGAAWTPTTAMHAARGGHLACLQYCHENGATWDVRTSAFAAQNSTADCLRYCHEYGCPWDESTLEAAVQKASSFACVKYAIENGCPWDEYVCRKCGDESVRDYLHEKGSPCNCLTNPLYLKARKFLLKNGCDLAN